MATVRVGVSLPESLLGDLSYVAGRLGITRSALLVQLCSEPASDLRSLVELVPDNPTEQDVKRLRGKSTELVELRVNQARSMEDDLFRS